MQPEQHWRPCLQPGLVKAVDLAHLTAMAVSISGAANCDAGKCEAQLHNAALVRSCTHFFHRTHVQSPVHSFTQPSYFDSQES